MNDCPYYIPIRHSHTETDSELSLSLGSLRDSQGHCYSSRSRNQQLSDRSFGGMPQDQIEKRKKMGVQLNILQKNILCESNSTLHLQRQRGKLRVNNVSGFMKGRKQQEQKQTNQNIQNVHPVRLIAKGRAKQKIQTKLKVTKSQPINSSDLQEIRKIDITIYQLYMQIYQEFRAEMEKQKQNVSTIEQLSNKFISKQQQLSERSAKISEMDKKIQNENKKLQSSEYKWIDVIKNKVTSPI